MKGTSCPEAHAFVLLSCFPDSSPGKAACLTMSCESLPKEFAAWRNAMPGRGTGRMGQRDEIELPPGAAHAKTAPDDLVEFADLHELRDRQFPDRNDEPRLAGFRFRARARRNSLRSPADSEPDRFRRALCPGNNDRRPRNKFSREPLLRSDRWPLRTSEKASCPRSRRTVFPPPARARPAPGRRAAPCSGPRHRKPAADASAGSAGSCAAARHAARGALVFPCGGHLPNDEKERGAR